MPAGDSSPAAVTNGFLVFQGRATRADRIASLIIRGCVLLSAQGGDQVSAPRIRASTSRFAVTRGNATAMIFKQARERRISDPHFWDRRALRVRLVDCLTLREHRVTLAPAFYSFQKQKQNRNLKN